MLPVRPVAPYYGILGTRFPDPGGEAQGKSVHQCRLAEHRGSHGSERETMGLAEARLTLCLGLRNESALLPAPRSMQQLVPRMIAEHQWQHEGRGDGEGPAGRQVPLVQAAGD